MSKHKHSNQVSNECTLFVQGMHCSSCELLIEKKLLKKENISSVDVSRQNNTVQIVFTIQSLIDLNEINKEFKDLGYSFSYQQTKQVKSKIIYRDQTGAWKLNKKIFPKVLKIFALSFGLLLIFFVVEKMQLGRYVYVNTSSSLVAFFLLGLVAGVSSCAALVGGLLLSMTKRWHELYIDDDTKKFQPHILFHIGRLFSFFLLGGVLGLLGDSISFNNTTVYAVLVMLISIVMLILALQMLDVVWAQRLSIRLPKFITRAAADEQTVKGKYMPFFTGLLTFFLPCGFTLIAQGIALTTGSFFKGALVMFFFSLGTLPMLVSISFTGITFTKKPHLTAMFLRVAGIIIIFFVIYNINGQLNVLGLKSLSDVASAKDQEQTSDISSDNDSIILFGPDTGKRLSEVSGQTIGTKIEGAQLLQLTAQKFEYVPTGPTTLQANRSTKLVVQDKGILGCGSFITTRGLFNGYVSLKPGENVIDLGSPKAGTYK